MYILIGIHKDWKYQAEDSILKCIHCKSTYIRKDGLDRNKNQMYKCINCEKRFSERQFTPFLGMRIPGVIIELALVLNSEVIAPISKIQGILKDIGYPVSSVTIYKWINKYAQEYRKIPKKTIDYADKEWKIDPKEYQIESKYHCIQLVKDKEGQIVAIKVSQIKTSNTD